MNVTTPTTSNASAARQIAISIMVFGSLFWDDLKAVPYIRWSA